MPIWVDKRVKPAIFMQIVVTLSQQFEDDKGLVYAISCNCRASGATIMMSLGQPSDFRHQPSDILLLPSPIKDIKFLSLLALVTKIFHIGYFQFSGLVNLCPLGRVTSSGNADCTNLAL